MNTTVNIRLPRWVAFLLGFPLGLAGLGVLLVVVHDVFFISLDAIGWRDYSREEIAEISTKVGLASTGGVFAIWLAFRLLFAKRARWAESQRRSF